MAKFVKGQSGNPGGKIPLPEDIKEAAKLTKQEFIRICTRFLKMNIPELKAIVGDPAKRIPPDPTATVLELLVASIVLKGMSEGDQKRLDFILNRTIGPIEKSFNLTGNLQTTDTKVVIMLPANGREKK